MRKHFDDQIAQLGEQMMAMGALVENTIERAIRALQTDDMAEAAAIRDGDHIVDEKEREVEAMCIHMLLQQQPVARDLRTISAALKMITDMERIGDEASDICEIATMGHLRSPRPEHFASMAQAAISMVHRAIDAYVHKDIELAQQVELSDDIVDALFNDGTHTADDVAALERTLLESACVTPLWFQTKALLVQPGVQGLVFRPFGPVLDLTNATIAQ